MREINATTVIVNGQTVAVSKKPKYKRGTPKVEVKTSIVGDKVIPSTSEDFTEAVGTVSFALRNTNANISLLEDWQDNVGKNAIRLVDNETGFTKTFNNMSVEEDVEVDFDGGEFEVEMKGGQGI